MPEYFPGTSTPGVTTKFIRAKPPRKKVSLSRRFGLWFRSTRSIPGPRPPPRYRQALAAPFRNRAAKIAGCRREALNWALSAAGPIAAALASPWQFATTSPATRIRTEKVDERGHRVAAAVILRADSSEFLLAQRPQGRVYAGYWEFPGGKGRAQQRTVRRGAGSRTARGTRHFGDRLLTLADPRVLYPHATVRLNFWRVGLGRRDRHQRPSNMTRSTG